MENEQVISVPFGDLWQQGNTALPNALRRTILSDLTAVGLTNTSLSSMAHTREITFFNDYITLDTERNWPLEESIDKVKGYVDVLENTSSLKLEQLLHRMSMIFFNLSCEEFLSCPSDYQFTLQVTNTLPSQSDGSYYVTTRDIRFQRGSSRHGDTALLSRIFPSKSYPQAQTLLRELNARTGEEKSHTIESNGGYDLFAEQSPLLCILKPEETIHIQFAPRLLSAKHHASFSIVSKCFYTLPDDDVDPVVTFRIKTLGTVYSPASLLEKAVHSISDRLLLVKQLVTSQDANISVSATNDESHFAVTFFFNNYLESHRFSGLRISVPIGHTIGNLIQWLLFKNCVQESIHPMTFVGYRVVHPLSESVEITIVLKSADSTTARQLAVSCISSCKDMLRRETRCIKEFTQQSDKSISPLDLA